MKRAAAVAFAVILVAAPLSAQSGPPTGTVLVTVQQYDGVSWLPLLTTFVPPVACTEARGGPSAVW